MLSDRIKRQELEQKHVELELKQTKDILYIHILMSFGTISILIAAIMLLMFEKALIAKAYAMMAIGIFLLLTGRFWQLQEEKNLEKLSEDIQRYRDQEASTIRSK